LRGFGLIFFFFWSESVRNGQNRSENSPQFRVGGISHFFLVETGRNGSKQAETTSANQFLAECWQKGVDLNPLAPRKRGEGQGEGFPKRASSPRPSPPQVCGREGETQVAQKLICPPKRRAQALGLQVVQSKVQGAELHFTAFRDASRPVLFQPPHPIPAFSSANIHIHAFTTSIL
jgi:hypothetical protein